MRKLHIIVSLVSLLLFVGCGGGEDIVDKETPVIVSQSIVSGAVDVVATPQKVLIVFNRTIREGNVEAVTLEPTAPMEVSVNDKVLTINLYEGLEYSIAYTLTLGYGAVLDQLTGGENRERIIQFTTDEKPYRPSHTPNYNLVMENALPVAQSIYDYLWESNGNSVLSGASVSPRWTANDCDWVYRKTGKYPAIASFDYRYLYASPSTSMNYTDTSMVEEWWQSGGLVAATWLWMVPKKEGGSACTFSGEDTALSIGNMLKEGSWENQVMQCDFEEMASILLLLQQKGVVVLWRPIPRAAYREATDSAPYYWWGREGGKAYKRVWRAMFDYFESRGVRNLVWIWTSFRNDTDYYPGDEYVDIVSVDMYDRYSPESCLSYWDVTKQYFPQKLLFISEFERMITIGEQLDAGASWGAFVSAYDGANDGSDEYVHQAASAEWWNEVLLDVKVVTRDELPNFEK